MFNIYPYLNYNDLNLDYILRKIKELGIELDNFINLNTIKYADPIQWNITTQYEANTVVIDPLTGTAYLSKQPVPSGVAITNADYWDVIFDLSGFIVRAAKNFTTNFEESSTLIATFPLAVNDWVVWGDVLYHVIAPIAAGDYYVIGTNIEHITIEDILGHLEDLHTINHDTFVDAINELDAEIGNLDALTTDVKNSLVGAINSGVNNLNVLDQRTWLYVDAQNGNDDNDGTTQATALRTLDKALELMGKGKLQINIGLLTGDTYNITKQTISNCALHLYNYSGNANPTVNFTANSIALYRMHCNINGDPDNLGLKLYLTANSNSMYWDGSDLSLQYVDTTGITGTFGMNGGQAFIQHCEFNTITLNYTNAYINECTFNFTKNNSMQGRSSVLTFRNLTFNEPAAVYQEFFFFTGCLVAIAAQASGFTITNKPQYVFRLESCVYTRGGSAKTNFLTACTNTPNEFYNLNTISNSP